MKTKVFISYRREDAAGHAGRLRDKLAEHFGNDHVFIDVDTIKPSEDFINVLNESLDDSRALVVVIGKRWRERLGNSSNPNDFVLLEVAAALKRKISVIPVLVQSAIMPTPEELPEDIKALSRLQALEISDVRWSYDVGLLIKTLEQQAGIKAPNTSTRISGWAIASLVFSLVIPIGCLPAIICGHLARRNIRRNSLLLGARIALAGLIIGYISLVICVAIFVAGVAGRMNAPGF